MMRKLRAFWMRLVSLLRHKHVEKEFSEEIEAHIALDIENGLRSGLPESEARRQALIRLGGVEQARQSYRDAGSVIWLENLLQDLRYGLRTLRRSPGFTTSAVLTLGLGIGACTAVFSLVNAVLIRSLPYGHPDQLVYLFEPNPRFNVPAEVFGPSYGDFYDIERQSHSFQAMTIFSQATYNVASQGTAERVGAARVDGDFFATLQAFPELGRALGPEDDQPGREKVAVISHSFWRSMFGGSADVLTQKLVLNGDRFQIVGVMPVGFAYPHDSDVLYGIAVIKATDIWVPLALTPKQKADRDTASGNAIARLGPGVTIAQAEAEIGAIMARIDLLHNPKMRGWGALVENFSSTAIGPVTRLLWMLLGAVVIVLMIACGNAASLLLARASARMRELGVRLALGAGRSRIIHQLLAESFLIAIAGGLTGVGLALVTLRVLPRMDPHNIPRLNEASLDSHVLLFTLLVSLLTSLLTGILSGLAVSRSNFSGLSAIGGSRGVATTNRRAQRLLIVAETALVVVLLASAGLLIRSYINVVSVNTGFSQSTVSMNISLDARYSEPKQRVAFFRDLIRDIGSLPGVSAAGAINDLPLSNTESLDMFWVDGFPNVEDQLAEARWTTAQYFPAMHIPLVAGRLFADDDDVPSARTVIVNQSFARKYFAIRDPIGGRISQDERHTDWNTVVGVVGDVRHSSLEEMPVPQIYFPFGRGNPSSAYITVQSQLLPKVVVNEIRAALKTIDPNLAVADIHTMGRTDIRRKCAAPVPDSPADGICCSCAHDGSGGPVRADGVLCESTKA